MHNQAELTAAPIGHGFEAQTIRRTAACKDASGATIGLLEIISTTEGYGGGMQFSMGIASTERQRNLFPVTFRDGRLVCVPTQTISRISSRIKAAEAFSYTKSGASADDEIDALSGATLTTNAVTNGVNAGIAVLILQRIWSAFRRGRNS